jgi:putative YhdH/YhfP family quinone oxidoreductase
MSFKAILVEQAAKGVTAAIREVGEEQLPEGDVTVAIDYSTLNYKDGLILGGLGGLVKRYPHVPGVDFAGTVESARSGKFKPGDKVILNGWRVGEVQWGGYAQKARVKPEWLVRLPDGLSTKEAMAIGTAGYTAMLAVMALEQHGIGPDSGEILVTGAAGGVGSVAVQLAIVRGAVVIGTGSPESQAFIARLGAVPTTYGQGLPERVRALHDGRVDLALDVAGAGSLPELIAITGTAASVVTIADFTGPRLGVRLSTGDLGGEPNGRHGLAVAAALFEEGRFRVPLRKVFPLAEAAQAHALAVRGPRQGKIALSLPWMS